MESTSLPGLPGVPRGLREANQQVRALIAPATCTAE